MCRQRFARDKTLGFAVQKLTRLFDHDDDNDDTVDVNVAV